jgi:hypothetical protein
MKKVAEIVKLGAAIEESILKQKNKRKKIFVLILLVVQCW